MADTPEQITFNALKTVLDEIVDGADPANGWLLNRGDQGLLRSLAQVSAEDASKKPANGGATIAAHTDHLVYCLQLLNRWSLGEDPFATADYAPSWQRETVSPAEWDERRNALAREAHAWQAVLSVPRTLTPIEMNGVVASLAHLAYHLGALRQVDHRLAGPSADAAS